ncbi:MAG: hypothetical protein CMB20_001290 [Methanobacteriota archaeon]|nr:MAG: hypothetical protein CMB20_001290 [Euryarchaeota archaeon]|tara:strand:- start:1001 stop:2572 length:1572 start_codon:yes stop_codon:yes gene_type:complete
MAITTQGYVANKQPIAQSFYVDEPNGIYCTKVDLFFGAKDASLPVQIQIRPMDNGFPSASQIIPGSQVVLAASSVNVDTTGPDLTATSFTFDEPIFLKGKEDFALVVVADSKEYQIYIAEINEFTFGSTEQRVNKNPVSGSLFYSQNGATFTPAQNQDLSFVLHQAKFKHTSASLVLHNASVPKRKLNPNPITTTSGQNTIRVRHLNHGLQVADKVTISGVTSVGGMNASSINGARTVIARDFTGYTFAADSSADSDEVGGGSSILADRNLPYSLAYPNITSLNPKTTSIEAGMKATTGKSFAGTETAFQKASDFEAIKLNENNIASKVYIVANDSSETANLGAGNKSLDVQLKLTTSDSNVSPMIDLQRASMSLVSNVIDKQDSSATSGFNVPINFVNETAANLGSSAAKHLTKIITLASDAVGIRVLLDANVPDVCDFELYFRTATSDEQIDTKTFTLVTPENILPKDNNPNIFREYRYLIGGQGGFLTAFTKYQLKIVMRSTNQALVPRFQSLRGIALSV